LRIEVFFINLGHFARFRGFLNTYSKKCRLLFRNVRLLKDILREVKAFLNKLEDFIKISRLFEDISREMETSV
jgi:hypothetical protein